MKKAISLLLALVMVLALAAPVLADDEVTEGPHGLVYAEDQTLRLVYSTEAETLHPYAGSNTAGTW